MFWLITRGAALALILGAALGYGSNAFHYLQAIWTGYGPSIELPLEVELNVAKSKAAAMTGEIELAQKAVSIERVATRQSQAEYDKVATAILAEQSSLRELAYVLQASSCEVRAALENEFSAKWAAYKQLERLASAKAAALKSHQDRLKIAESELDTLIAGKAEIEQEIVELETAVLQLRNDQSRSASSKESRLGEIRDRIGKLRSRVEVGQELLVVQGEARPVPTSRASESTAIASPVKPAPVGALKEYQERFPR